MRSGSPAALAFPLHVPSVAGYCGAGASSLRWPKVVLLILPMLQRRNAAVTNYMRAGGESAAENGHDGNGELRLCGL